MTAQIYLARTLASQGALRQADEMLRKIIQVNENIPILSLAHYDLSSIYYQWNDLAKAWEHLEQGLEMSTRVGNPELQIPGHILKTLLLMAQGNLLEAMAEIDTTHALSRDLSPTTQARSIACHVQIALAMGDLITARQWIESMTENVDANSFYRFLGLSRVRLFQAEGRKDEAVSELKECYERTREAGWGYAKIAILVLRALAARKQESALEFLTEALQLAQPEGYIRTFADAGMSIVPLLHEVAEHGIMPGYIGQILGKCLLS